MRKTIFLGITATLLIVIAGAKQTVNPVSTLQQPSLKASIAAGKDVYTQYCVSCHLPDGGGVQNMQPTLIKTSYVNGDKARLAGVLLKGMAHVPVDGETYTNVMPSFNYLSDKQIADVLTYIRNSFGNKKTAVQVAEVKAVRAKLPK